MENLESNPDQKIRLLVAALVNEQPPDIPDWAWRALRRIARRIEEKPVAILGYVGKSANADEMPSLPSPLLKLLDEGRK